jgi:hypothetical protein
VLHQSAGYRRGGEGRPFDEGEMKGGMSVRFSSIWVREGGTRRRMAWWRIGRGGGSSGVRRCEKTPGWADLGQRPERLGWQGDSHGIIKLSCYGFWAKIKDLNRWASDLIFELISRILSLKSKVSNISNWILN